MCEAQIDIKNIKKSKNHTELGGGCRHSFGGGYLPPLGGGKNIAGSRIHLTHRCVDLLINRLKCCLLINKFHLSSLFVF